MRQEQERKFDVQLASLDGGLFPASMRHDSASLIQLDAVAFELDEPSPRPGRLPLSDAPPPAHSVSVFPPAPEPPRPRWHLTAAAVAGCAGLTALCAVAFQGSVPRGTAAADEAVLPAVAALAGMPAVDMSTDAGDLDVFPAEAAIPEVAAPEAAAPTPEVAAPEVAAPSPPVIAVAPRPHPATPAPIAPISVPTGGPVPNELAMLGAAPVAFDPAGAAIAIAIAARGAGCAERGGQHRSAPVSVTFAPSGHVTTARVEGDVFAGTPAGSCVARALRAATVHPFEGSPVTVHGSVHVD